MASAATSGKPSCKLTQGEHFSGCSTQSPTHTLCQFLPAQNTHSPPPKGQVNHCRPPAILLLAVHGMGLKKSTQKRCIHTRTTMHAIACPALCSTETFDDCCNPSPLGGFALTSWQRELHNKHTTCTHSTSGTQSRARVHPPDKLELCAEQSRTSPKCVQQHSPVRSQRVPDEDQCTLPEATQGARPACNTRCRSEACKQEVHQPQGGFTPSAPYGYASARPICTPSNTHMTCHNTSTTQ